MWGKLGVVVDGSAFETDGYPIVADRPSAARSTPSHGGFPQRQRQAAVRRRPTACRRSFRAGYFRENRDNGKASTIDGTEEANDTTLDDGQRRRALALPDESTLQVSLFGDFETFRSNFLAVPAATPPRSIGRMTLNQRVPTDAIGGMAQWSRGVGAQAVLHARHRLALGRRRQRGRRRSTR